jgi:uncharacterized protein (TIGR02284 family)
MSTNTDTSKLDDLIHTLIDSIKGYENSAQERTESRFVGFFREMARDRREAVNQLQAQSRALGGSPSDQGSVAGALHRRWEDLRAALGGGDKAVIQEVERGEDYLKEEFERALADENISEETRAVIRTVYGSVRRGHDQASMFKKELEATN